MNVCTCEAIDPSVEQQHRLPVPLIAGETRIEEWSTKSIREEFQKQATSMGFRGLLQGNNLVCGALNIFLSEANITKLQKTIQTAVDLMLNRKPNATYVPRNSEFVLSLVECAIQNIGAAGMIGKGSIDAMVRAMNSDFVKKEAEVIYYSHQQHQRYTKWILQNDRMRVFPYGETERHTKGEVTLSFQDYTLLNPQNRFRSDFLKNTVGLRETEPGVYQRIPHFRETTMSSFKTYSSSTPSSSS